MSGENEQRRKRISLRMSEEELEVSHRLWARTTRGPCWSVWARRMLTYGYVVQEKSFTDPTRIGGAVVRVGLNIDSLLVLARDYGIEPGEIQELAGQMKELNKRLDRWWDDYERMKDREERMEKRIAPEARKLYLWD